MDAFDEAVAGCDGNCTADCTLRDAITMANSNPGSDIIEVPIGSPDIILAIAGASEDNNTTGDHDIWDTTAGTTLTIRLNGTRVVNQAGVAHRLFHALATGSGRHAVTLVIENGQVVSGHAMNQPGGCVYAEEAPLVLDEVRFKSCDSEWVFAGVTGGGAVAAMGGATITDSAFNDSQVTDADGGAVYVEGDLEITDTTFEDNIIVGPTGRGGAVRWSGSGNTAELTNVTVDRCSSQVNGGGMSLRDATGVARLSGIDLDENETGGNGANLWTDVDDLAATEVVATGGSALNRGGGWYMIPGTGPVGPGVLPVCDRCAFTGNEAGTEAGGVGVHVRAGTAGGTFVFRNTTIGENKSGMFSGGPGTNPGAGFWLAGGAAGGSGPLRAVTTLLQHATVVDNLNGAGLRVDLHVQDPVLTIAMEHSIVDGPCEATVPPPGVFLSLGGNVFWTDVGAQNCPLTGSDTNPAAPGLSVFTAGAATLVTSPSPHYDNLNAPASIDFVTCPAAVTVDQLGNARPTGAGLCDSGAVEQ